MRCGDHVNKVKNVNRFGLHRESETARVGLTSVCCISNVFPIAGTNEELDLGEERLKVGGVWHGELHKSNREEAASSDHQETFMQHKKHFEKKQQQH